MSVYVDNMDMKANVRNGANTVRGVWNHMTADTDEELHAMAQRIGMRLSWYQKPRIFPDNEATRAAGVVGQTFRRGHYDLVKTRKAKAIKFGAIEVKFGREPWRAEFTALWEKWLDWNQTDEAKEIVARLKGSGLRVVDE